jgi:polysaccharide biosynthesis/export protein
MSPGKTKPVLTLLFIALSFLFLPASWGADAGAQWKDPGGDYKIGPEDVLDISVWKNADLSKTVTVRPDGKISLPLIGDLEAAGHTAAQLKEEIVVRLKKYQETAVVSVIVQAVNSYRVFVVGEVKTPGPYLLKTRTTVLQAIAMAGGFTQFASKNKMVLVRPKGDGSDERIRVSFDDLVYGGDRQENLILKAGDTIFVP